MSLSFCSIARVSSHYSIPPERLWRCLSWFTIWKTCRPIRARSFDNVRSTRLSRIRRLHASPTMPAPPPRHHHCSPADRWHLRWRGTVGRRHRNQWIPLHREPPCPLCAPARRHRRSGQPRRWCRNAGNRIVPASVFVTVCRHLQYHMRICAIWSIWGRSQS